ncbi:MAG: hypothetical protein ABSA47_05980, partial [Verrucomicrobiota bacterium]
FFNGGGEGSDVNVSKTTNGVLVSETTYSYQTGSLSASTNLTLYLSGLQVETIARDVVKHQVVDYGSGATWTVAGYGATVVGGASVPIVVEGTAKVSAPTFLVGPQPTY